MGASSYSTFLGAVGASALLLASGPALADDKQECSAAYDATQALRRDKKLADARSQAEVCARDACAAFIRDDCAAWRGELDAAQPSVVIDATDPRGGRTTAVRVTLDGEPWLPSLDGKATPIDPGRHTLRFELDGARTLERSVEVAEGEKALTLTISFARPLPPAQPVGIPPRVDDRASPAPWIVGGVGAAGLVAGGVMGGLVVAARSSLPTHCVFESGHVVCDGQGVSAASTVRTLAPATTIALVGGGAALAAGTLWIVVRKAKAATPPTAIGLAPAVSATEGGLRIRGIF